MTQEEKQLLLKDLCARLPYGVEIICEASRISLTLSAHMLGEIIKDGNELRWKPYLRQMESMTDEEKSKLQSLQKYYFDEKYIGNNEWEVIGKVYYNTVESLDWLVANHFDYRGLIPMGLALEAKEGMYV